MWIFEILTFQRPSRLREPLYIAMPTFVNIGQTRDFRSTEGGQGEMTSRNLWSLYVRHFVGIAWRNVWS